MMEKLTREKLSDIRQKFILEAAQKYHKSFLLLTGLNVGDSVLCSFTSNHGNAEKSYLTRSNHHGIIKQDENGTLFVESLEKLTVSKRLTNDRTGRQSRSWWEYEKQHVIASIDDIYL